MSRASGTVSIRTSCAPYITVARMWLLVGVRRVAHLLYCSSVTCSIHSTTFPSPPRAVRQPLSGVLVRERGGQFAVRVCLCKQRVGLCLERLYGVSPGSE